jgi:hypothetical protein
MQKKKKDPNNGVWRNHFNKTTTLYTNIEEPCTKTYRSFHNKGGLIRLYEFDVNQKNTAQYAYELDPIAQPT